MSWLEEKQQVAASDDYGKDLDHLEMLQKKFDDFKREVANNTSQYTTVNNFGRRLIAEGKRRVWLVGVCTVCMWWYIASIAFQCFASKCADICRMVFSKYPYILCI